jgi:MFS family permease
VNHASTASAASEGRSPRSARALAVLDPFHSDLLNLLNYLDRRRFAVLTPFEMNSVQRWRFGPVNTIFMVGYFLTSPIFGYLGDRASRKWLIAAGIFVWTRHSLTGGATSFAWLLLHRAGRRGRSQLPRSAQV